MRILPKRIRTALGRFRTRCRLQIGFLAEAVRFWTLTRKYNASANTDGDIEKMQYTLLRENHVIEKGLSMRLPRKGFGQEKVMSLLARLGRYLDAYGSADADFVRYPLDTVAEYIRYTKGQEVAIDKIETAFRRLCDRVHYVPQTGRAGTRLIGREEIALAGKMSFAELLDSRHSIRYFDSESQPSRAEIENALCMAQRTPSACNRQAWKTHVFQGDESVDLIKWQGGSRGFEDEIRSSILVTANLKGFLWHEVHQAYVDGGLYAMNLINSLHSLGMGTIPLSTGFDHRKIKGLESFGIPENEVPIVIIGFGRLLPSFRIAVSTRKSITKTNVFHGVK